MPPPQRREGAGPGTEERMTGTEHLTTLGSFDPPEKEYIVAAQKGKVTILRLLNGAEIEVRVNGGNALQLTAIEPSELSLEMSREVESDESRYAHGKSLTLIAGQPHRFSPVDTDHRAEGLGEGEWEWMRPQKSNGMVIRELADGHRNWIVRHVASWDVQPDMRERILKAGGR